MCLVTNTKPIVMIATCDILVIKLLTEYWMTPFTYQPVPDDGKMRNPEFVLTDGENMYAPYDNDMDNPCERANCSEIHGNDYVIGVGFHSYAYDAQGAERADRYIASSCVAYEAVIPKGTRYVTDGHGHYVSDALDIRLSKKIRYDRLLNLP